MKRIVKLCVLATAVVGCSGDAATAPLDVPPALALVGDEPVSYSSTAGCDQSVLVDPGTVKVVDGLQIIKGRVFDCPVTGDLPGTVRVTWRNAVFGAGPEGGRIVGTTEWFVDDFFGRTDLEGTFIGPFSGSLDEIIFGKQKSNRVGTGDFSGLVMHGVFFQDPPGGPTFESGIIIGN